MDDNLHIELPSEDERPPLLPYNYFPAALAAISESHDAQNRHLFVLPGAQLVPQDQALSYVVSAATMRDPAKMAAFLLSLEPAIDVAEANQSCFLGHETTLAETNQPRAQTLIQPQLPDDGPYARVVVVIDHGIAFWNRAFLLAGTTRFTEIQYLDFDAGNPLAPLPVGRLSAADLASLCAEADLPNGPAAVLKTLKKQFPRSFYGSYPPPNPDALWHGTAIADIAAPNDGGKTALFGVELPDAALRDWGGDTLQYVLPTALRAALKMTNALSHLPLVIVLPFAFTAGPHDGSHPIAQYIKTELDRVRPARTVSLVLPAGNHLQDQCTAFVPQSGPGPGASSISWHVPPDDFSANTVEIVVENVALDMNRPRIDITAPGGSTVQAELLPNQVARLRMRGEVIGILKRAADVGGNGRYRLSTTPTGWLKGSVHPAPFGTWQISIATTQPATLWVLRDERDSGSDMARPNRGSYFTDPKYRVRDPNGAYFLADMPVNSLRRSGTGSVLATAGGPETVAALESLGPNAAQPAYYSGRDIAGRSYTRSVLVDDGYEGRGVNAVGNGTDRVFRVSGTSAASALVARDLYR